MTASMRMMSNKVWAWMFVCLLIFMAAGCRAASKRLCAGKACFDVEIAATDAARTRGLMFRHGLKDGTGMLFVFDEEGGFSFWMKNMRFPIDMLWLDRNMRLVDIKANVPACTVDPCPVYTPSHVALYVLELPAGDARRHDLIPGVIFSNG